LQALFPSTEAWPKIRGKTVPSVPKSLLKILVDDQSVTPEDYNNLIKEMNEGNADWQIITYAHSKHTFTDPKSIIRMKSWPKSLNHTPILKEILK
jgi:hypothetical protein